MLIVFGGLPGTGKTTLSREVARARKATWLRIDAIEAAMWQAGVARSEPTGLAAYVVAFAMARTQLQTGGDVVIDAVNPVQEARDGWADLAQRSDAPWRVIEVTCSDRAEHRRRVEQRGSDLPGFPPPTWDEVMGVDYQPWRESRLTVDTMSPAPEILDAIERFLAGQP